MAIQKLSGALEMIDSPINVQSTESTAVKQAARCPDLGTSQEQASAPKQRPYLNLNRKRAIARPRPPNTAF